jgi:branched-chain amino acid aminotransferase
VHTGLVPYDEARVHVLSTAFKYGATVFEGLRAYWNEEQQELYGFRLREHFQRLVESLRICRMGSPLTVEGYTDDLLRLIRANDLREDLHMRVSAFVEEDDGGLASHGPISVAMAALPLGRYFSKEGLDVQVSSWTRISDQTMPPRIKAVPNYHNSRLALLQARADGYDDALLLSQEGKVTEGPGYALFMVRGGQLVTPPVTAGILESITRDSVITLAREAGLSVVERQIDRTELYVADELFFCGSAAEVTPIFSVDRIAVGAGTTGPTTARLRQAFLATVRGEVADTHAWLTPIFASASQAAAVATPAATAVSAT